MKKINTIAVSLLMIAALVSCNNDSSKKEDGKKTSDSIKPVTNENVPTIDSANSSLQVRAQYIEYSLGDASHYIFKDDNGKFWDFAGNEDTTYKFAVELPKGKANSSNQGWGSDKAFQGKWFRITYTKKTQPQYEGGPMAEVPVILRVSPENNPPK